MAEQTFRSPGFFEQEIDLSTQQQAPQGTPAGVIGTALKGPAFVPVTVGSFNDFVSKFGGLDPKKFGPYAAREFLKHRNALTYTRVLGAGANDTTADIEVTRTRGTVKNAGLKLESQAAPSDATRHAGAVQFLVARHFASASEAVGYPSFAHNDSFGTTTDDFVSVVRSVILTPSGTRVMVMDGTGASFSTSMSDQATLNTTRNFKLVISSSSPGFSSADGLVGLRILTASLDPESSNYVGKILNTDPEKFLEEEHLLYADFPVESELLKVASETASVGILSGSVATSTDAGDTTVPFRNLFGRFDTRFTTAKTTKFISQPFGGTEYDLFHFEALDDGSYANTQVKISISDLKKSANQADPFGTFTVTVRSFDDSDTIPKILERFPNVSLNPQAQNYIARQVGDKKVYYDFDADREEERRLVVTGKYPNRSKYVRVVIDPGVEKKVIPHEAIPFGFRGVSVLKTADNLTDVGHSSLPGFSSTSPRRLGGAITNLALSSSIVPPLPFRFKVTKGAVNTSGGFVGNPGVTEIVDSRLHWGVKFETLPSTSSVSDAVYNSNAGAVLNETVRSYTKFLGIQKMDTLVTGSGCDAFNNNKFTLARVAFSNASVSQMTGSTKEHMREAAYVRNGRPDSSLYRINDGVLDRVTLASLVAQTGSADFNRFSEYAKFTTILGGGFDGVNFLDRDASRLSDRAASSDTGGGASTDHVSPGLLTNVNGTGRTNNAVSSYRTAAKLMTDPFVTNANILAIPGVRDSFVTNDAADKVKEYGLAVYVMDPVEYDESGNRLFDGDVVKPDVRKTKENFESRAIDNNYVASYFPDVVIDDSLNNRKVMVPPSVAVLGAFAYNDKTSYPWFAPAGFNRASLSFVTNVDVRLSNADRDSLYDARINPIATFPREGFVIWGQKTLQQAQSALDRVNVRRLMIEVKRVIMDVAQRFVFEQNNEQTQKRFKGQVTPILSLIQLQSGIERFDVVMDSSNNTQQDVEANRLNGRVVVVPTRAVEFISVDFVVATSGVSFV